MVNILSYYHVSVVLTGLIPSIFATSPQTNAYVSGNTSITTVGPWTQTGFGYSVQRVNWEIMNVSSGSLVQVNRSNNGLE